MHIERNGGFLSVVWPPVDLNIVETMYRSSGLQDFVKLPSFRFHNHAQRDTRSFIG